MGIRISQRVGRRTSVSTGLVGLVVLFTLPAVAVCGFLVAILARPVAALVLGVGVVVVSVVALFAFRR